MAHSFPSPDEVDPNEAYALLEQTEDIALVDVRSRAEWVFTGVPDVSATGRPFWMVEWASFPQMAQNVQFLEDLTSFAEGTFPQHLLFICRSGARSMNAAHLVAGTMHQRGVNVRCTNVGEGFEGDLDEEGHRGTLNGWKFRGLPWRQN